MCWGSDWDGALGNGARYSDYIGDGLDLDGYYYKDADDFDSELGDALIAVDFGTVDGTNLTAKNLACGYVYTCALLSDDTIKCWGYNRKGDLGQGNTDAIGDEVGEMGDNLAPVDLGTDSSGNNLTAKSMSCGLHHTCAVLSDDTIKCWGYNSKGQLGQGNTATIGDGAGEMGNALVAVDLGTGLTAKSVLCGDEHTCAVLSDATINCWGYNRKGELGQGNTDAIGDEVGEMGDNLAPVDLGTDGSGNNLTAKSLACGYQYTCAVLNDDTLKCWGRNYEGQIGEKTTFEFGSDYGDYTRDDYDIGDEVGDMGDNLARVNLGTNRTVLTVFIPSDGYSTCALLDDYSLKCWGGRTGSGMLGNERAAYFDDYIGDGMEVMDNGDQVVTGVTEMGDNLVPVNLGTGRTV